LSNRQITRRSFLGGTAASAFAFTVLPGCIVRKGRRLAPSDRLNIASIGVGGKGTSDVRGVASENIVALCDVDWSRGAGNFKKFPKARKFKDFRVMLDAMDKEIDAVTVSTPDHVHAPASMMAIKMGKHVFCQKPMTHSIYEARMVAKAARKHKVATMVGIQGHCNEGPRLVCEWLKAGWLGQVREVHYWTNRPIWPQGIGRPTDTPPVPKTLDWDLWLGPAPKRPYHPAYAPFKWRGWWDFGCGALGDIGCHAMDAAFWALKLGHPTSVEAVSPPVNDETAPKWSIVTYQFPARGNMAPVKVVWHDGDKKPPRPKDLEKDRNLPGGIGGQLLIGDKATILAGTYCRSPRVVPETKMRDLLKTKPPKSIPRSPGIYAEWLRACKGGPACGANFVDFAGPLTEMVLLGNLAVRTAKKLEWDGEHMRVTNVPEANQFVRREYRKGWTL